VSLIWHSAKEPLPSVPDVALGKAYFKNKKILCRVPDHGHSAKHVYITLVILLSLSVSHAAASPPPRRRDPARRRAAPRPRRFLALVSHF
jgi:hypothetical protein